MNLNTGDEISQKERVVIHNPSGVNLNQKRVSNTSQESTQNFIEQLMGSLKKIQDSQESDFSQQSVPKPVKSNRQSFIAPYHDSLAVPLPMPRSSQADMLING